MTIRAADYLKIDLDGDLNEGLDALEKHPALAVKGPFVKSKIGPLMPTHTFTRLYRYWYNSVLQQEDGPYKDLYTPTCFIPCPGIEGGYWRSTASRIDQIWWFRTPPESRPPVYLSKEKLEERALRNYEKKIQRRFDLWSYDVENSFEKFIEWKSRKLFNLDRAMTRIRNKRRTTMDDLKKLSSIQRKYREVESTEFKNPLIFNHEEFGKYQARYLDFWTHKYADDRARWLGTPHPTYILPVWHLKLNCGYAVATLSQTLGDFTVNPAGQSSGWHSEIKDWADLSAQAPVGLFDKAVHYDEDALLDAVNDMLPRTKVHSNVVVTAIELREFGNLFSEMKTVLSELWKAVESYQKAGKNLMAIFNSSKFLLNYASKGPAHRKALFNTPDWKNVKSSVVYASKGCADAAQFLASRHLAMRFGDPDSVRALGELWDLFHSQFQRIMKPLYTALAAAGNTTSRHRTILDVSHSWESEYTCSGLFHRDTDEDGPHFQDEYDAWLLAPTDPILILRSESRIQKATLVTTDVLVDTFGHQVGVDEAVTRYIMDLVGFNFNPKTVWDLLPYTFVIDWFLDVGSILERYCSLTNLRFVSTIQGGCVSEHYRYTRSVAKRGQTHTSGTEELWRDGDGTYEYVTATNDVDVISKPLVARVYRRNPVPSSVLEKGRLRFKWDDYFLKGIGASQLLCGVELLMQRITN